MKNKKIILISIIGLLLIGFFSLYNSLKIVDYESKIIKHDNYFIIKVKRIVPQSIKNFMKDTMFVFKKASFLEQQLEYRKRELADKDKQLSEILDHFNDLQFFGFKKNKIQKKKLHNTNLLFKTFTSPLLKKNRTTILSKLL